MKREKSSESISVDKQLVKKPGRVTPSLGKAEKQEGSGADSSLSTVVLWFEKAKNMDAKILGKRIFTYSAGPRRSFSERVHRRRASTNAKRRLQARLPSC